MISPHGNYPCIRVSSAISEDVDNTSIRLEALGNHTEQTSRQAARPKIRVARLHDIYSIAFATYKCQDLGCLVQGSIRTLRSHYVQHLNKKWDLATDVPWTSNQSPDPWICGSRTITTRFPMDHPSSDENQTSDFVDLDTIWPFEEDHALMEKF